MRRGGRLASVLLGVAMLLGTSAAQTAWVKLEPADAGFSVFFPVTPTFNTDDKPGSVTRVWTARAGKLVCRIVVVDYKGRVAADEELEADMTNFLKAVEGTATSKQKLSFGDAPDGPLPALRFSFTMAGWTGQSLVVVAGDRTYQAVGIAEAGSDTKDLARCVAFKVTAKPRHWQAP